MIFRRISLRDLLSGVAIWPLLAVCGLLHCDPMKAGVANLAKSLAIELGPSGIRVNTVAPDVFPTPAAVPGWRPEDDAAPERLLSDRISIPLQRKGQGEDISGPVLFLASDLASYITGTTVHIDGGTSGSAGWLDWPDAGYQCVVPDDIARLLVDHPAGTRQTPSS